MFILAKKYGRLCNRLFNAAHILASAIEHKQTFINLSFYEYASEFQATKDDLLCRYPARTGLFKSNRALSGLLYQGSYYFSYLLFHLSNLGLGTGWLGLHLIRPPRNKHNHLVGDLDLESLPVPFSDTARVFLFQGWNLRSFELLQKHGDAVREYFRPAEPYWSGVRAFLEEKREGCEVLAGVVIRHGDYRKYLGGKFFYPIEAYLSWMQQLQAALPGKKVRFLIFSDEEQETAPFRSAGLDFFFRSGHPMENLYALAGCDYIVTPPSTYGMWASFYGRTPLCIVETRDQPLSLESFSICQG